MASGEIVNYLLNIWFVKLKKYIQIIMLPIIAVVINVGLFIKTILYDRSKRGIFEKFLFFADP